MHTELKERRNEKQASSCRCEGFQEEGLAPRPGELFRFHQYLDA